MWETIDPDGRRVVLTHERWRHIVEEHEELGLEPSDILAVVAEPEHRLPGRGPQEEWFYRGGAGPSRWVKVVVHYEQTFGRIVTAFPRRALP
ncbi:MAG: hypothetical protein WD249_03700 [Gaiellaceae bacterium]